MKFEGQDEDYVIFKANVFDLIRNNQNKSKTEIIKLLKAEFGYNKEWLKTALIELLQN